MKKKISEKQIEKQAKELAKQIEEVIQENTATTEEINAAKTLITNSICNLVYAHPLTYGIVSQCNLKPAPGLKTFGVKLSNDSIDLLYDPKVAIKWFKESPEKITAIMQHEAYHLVFSHLTLGPPGEVNVKDLSKELTQKEKQTLRMWNIALDFKVNENIHEIWNGDQKGGLFEGGCGKTALKQLVNLDNTDGKNSIEVYNLLKKEAQQKQMPEQTDEHGFGDEQMDATEAEKQAAVVQRIIKRAAEQLSEKQRGDLPGSIRQAVDQICFPKLDKRKWQDLLKQFLCSIRKPTKEGTWKRPSRRYGVKAKGKKHQTQPNLAICLDTSGSMNEEDIEKVLGVIQAYSHRFGQVHLIAGDTQVCYSDLIRKGNAKTKLMQFKTGRGGTILQPLLDKAKEVRAHGVIMVSDGFCEQLRLHCKTVGLITRSGQNIPGVEHNLTLDEMIK